MDVAVKTHAALVSSPASDYDLFEKAAQESFSPGTIPAYLMSVVEFAGCIFQ
jgi:hypothetical protein